MMWCSKLSGADRKKFIILDIVFTISGILLLAVGILSKYFYYTHEDFLSYEFCFFATYPIVLGSLVLVLPILAYYGFAKGMYCKMAFFIPLIVILSLEMKATVDEFSMASRGYWLVYFGFPSKYERYERNNDTLMRKWNTIQSEFQCCGRDNYEEWERNVPDMFSGQLPLSCCKVPSNVTDFKCTKDGDVYATGCNYAFGTIVRILAGVTGGLLLISFIAQVAVSISLLRKVKFRFSCRCSYAQVSYRSYDCNCKSIIFVSKGCDGQNHLVLNPNEKDLSLPSQPLVYERIDNVEE